MSAKVIPFRRRTGGPDLKKKSTQQYFQTPLPGLFEMFEEAARGDLPVPEIDRPFPTDKNGDEALGPF